MKTYQKPVAIVNDELTEGVYTASGDTNDSKTGCDSKYMKGVFQKPDYSDQGGKTRDYRTQFGCLGCPAYTETACGLTTHYLDSDKAGSYDTDNGNRMPSWKRKGYKPTDPVTDWAMQLFS